MNRAGGWILGVLVVLAMAGGGWFALRKAMNRETAVVWFLPSAQGRDPTQKALKRGAQAALDEAGGRAGQFRIVLDDLNMNETRPVIAWIGTSEGILERGDFQPVLFQVAAFDSLPGESANWLHLTPGFAGQGRAAAAWATKSAGGRIFLLCDKGNRKSEAVADAFGMEARRLGLTVEGPAEAAGLPVQAILGSDCKLVFYSGEQAPYGTAFKVFALLRKAGFSGALVMADADPDVSFLATRPDLVDGTYLVSPFAPAAPEVAARLSAPGPHVTAGYYAMKAVLDAIDRANSFRTEDLLRAAVVRPSSRPCALYVARGGNFEFVELLE
jgi:hypothetical protein